MGLKAVYVRNLPTGAITGAITELGEEFSQDPERLPCVRWEFWYPDRVFRGNLSNDRI